MLSPSGDGDWGERQGGTRDAPSSVPRGGLSENPWALTHGPEDCPRCLGDGRGPYLEVRGAGSQGAP